MRNSNAKYIAAHWLNCKPDEVETLDTVVDIDWFLKNFTGEPSVEAIAKTVYSVALDELKTVYSAVAKLFKGNHEALNPILDEYSWDFSELKKAFDFLDPDKDLHYYSDGKFILELDYWDLYQSILGELAPLTNAKNWSFNNFLDSYSTEFYAGEKVPPKFDSIII